MSTSVTAGNAAELAASRKEEKNGDMATKHIFRTSDFRDPCPPPPLFESTCVFKRN